MKRDHFRGPLPLSDGDFAQIRSRVMQMIEHRSVAPIAWRLAFAAAAVAVIIFVLIPRPSVQSVQRPQRQTLSGRTPPPAPVTAENRSAPPKAGAESGGSSLIPERPATQRKPQTQIASNGAAPSDSEMHIEIQTGDPNIRIIWIASR